MQLVGVWSHPESRPSLPRFRTVRLLPRKRLLGPLRFRSMSLMLGFLLMAQCECDAFVGQAFGTRSPRTGFQFVCSAFEYCTSGQHTFTFGPPCIRQYLYCSWQLQMRSSRFVQCARCVCDFLVRVVCHRHRSRFPLLLPVLLCVFSSSFGCFSQGYLFRGCCFSIVRCFFF